MALPINWGIIKRPGNWFTVTLMLMIGFAFFDILLTRFAKTQDDANG